MSTIFWNNLTTSPKNMKIFLNIVHMQMCKTKEMQTIMEWSEIAFKHKIHFHFNFEFPSFINFSSGTNSLHLSYRFADSQEISHQKKCWVDTICIIRRNSLFYEQKTCFQACFWFLDNQQVLQKKRSGSVQGISSTEIKIENDKKNPLDQLKAQSTDNITLLVMVLVI